jgi:integrase
MPQQKQKQQQQIDYYQQFIDSLNRSKLTQQKYIQVFSYYLKWLGLGKNDANSLITETLLDSPAEVRKIEDQIIKHIKYMINNQKLAHATIELQLYAIFHFYSINRVNLNRNYISKFKPVKRRIHKDLAYTHEQILHLLNSTTDLRQRVIILLLASTGMRIGALPNMTVGALSRISVEGYTDQLYKITVYEGEPEEYYTFTTFECAIVLDQYLTYRQRSGEVLKSSSPLIREQFDSNDAFQVTRPQILSLTTFYVMMDSLLWKSGLKTRTRREERVRHEIMRYHGLRKFAITQMIKAKVDFSAREFLVGHRQSRGLDVNYDRTAEEDRLFEYLKAMDLLTTSPENRLRKQIAEQEFTIQHKLAEKDKQIKEMMNKQEQLIQSLIDSGLLKPSSFNVQ